MNKAKALKKIVAPLAIPGCAMLLALVPSAHAQVEKTLRFIPDKVDFGMVREENGKISRTVKAVNITSDSTFIISARTSCGCSAAEYSEDILAPGDTTEVTLTYDPSNRPGKFLKTVKFFTGKERIGNSIKLSGHVIPSPRNLDRTYPEQVGQLRLTSLLLNAGEMTRSEAKPLFVGIYNDSGQALPIKAETDTTALEATLMPDTIEPFGVATLSLMLKGRHLPEKDNQFLYKTYLLNRESGDTILCLPVGGIIKAN
ncbi:MAG: DUF1573 domain-containing protein [Muribaculaceae bacterium]|nr:DUF1573 domain-containing protein [Muribaculaceae bacterium]